MVDITIDEVTESTIIGSGYFDKFMLGINTHLKDQYDKHRIKSSEYAGVYLGAMQSALTEAVKLAIGRQLASAQADLAIANTSKVAIDIDLVTAEIAFKSAMTANVITENGLIVERITNLEKDTLIKVQQELVKQKEVIQAQSNIDKTAKEITKLVADIAKTDQDTANALSQNAVIVAEAARVIATTDKILEDTKLTTKQIDKVSKEIDLLTQEILVKSKEVQLMIAKISIMGKEELKVIADTALISERVVLTSEEIKKLTEEILNVIETTKLTTARTAHTKCETNKCGAETNLTKARVNTEKANTDGNVIGANSVIKENILLTQQKVITEKANVDGTIIGEESLFGHKNAKIIIDGESVKSKYNPIDIVIPGSLTDCETKLTCARVQTERANYTSIGEDEGQIVPDSFLGAKTQLVMAQASTEEANLDPTKVKENSYFDAKTDKVRVDIDSIVAQYDPTEAGVQVDSKLDCETKLACARAESERSNYTPIGIGEGEVSPTSLIGAKAQFLINQSKTEEANIDGTNIKDDSLLRYKLDKMKYDAIASLADYDPVEAGVKDGSKIDCEAKLTCAKVKTESANYTEIGNDPDQIDPTSYLGARTSLLIQQSKTEEANIDATNVKDGSLIKAKIEKSEADAKAVVATYDPEEGGVKGGSLLDCNTKLACARAKSEAANYTAVGEGVEQVNPTSLLGAKASLLMKQTDTEEANINPHKVQPESIYQAKIDKMVADANVALASYDPDEAGVQEGSKVACEADLLCARAKSEEANITPVGLGEDEVDPRSPVGAKAELIMQQTSTEKVNIDSSEVKTGSMLDHRINKLEFDSKLVQSAYDPITAGVVNDSKVDCEAKLTCAKAKVESAQYTEIGNDPDQIDPTSYLGARTSLYINQASTELANTDATYVKDNSLVKSRIDKTVADINNITAKIDPATAGVVSGSVVDCEAKLTCAKKELELAQLLPLGTDQGQLNPTSVLGSRANLLSKQADTEKANVDGSEVKADSLIKAKIDKALADARISLAQIDPVTAEVQPGSVVDCNAQLTCAKVISESAEYTLIGEGEGEINPGSALGFKAGLIEAQKFTEIANYDAEHVKKGSYLKSKIEKSESEVIVSTAKYNPVDIVVEDSLLDAERQYQLARARETEAQYTEIGNEPDQIDPTSFIGAKANLLIHQTETELAQFDASKVEPGSMMDAKIKKMEADSKNSLAQYDPEEAGVKAGSKVSCEAKLACAKATVELAQVTPVGDGAEDVDTDSLIGARANLYKNQAATELANTDGTGLGTKSFMKAKIDKMAADAEVAKAPLIAVGTGNDMLSKDSKFGAETLLMKARAATEKANVSEDDIDDDSYVGAKIAYLQAQEASEGKNKDKITEEIAFSQSKYKIDALAGEGSLIDCQAKLYCAQAGEHAAKYDAAIDPDSGEPIPLPPTSLMGAEALLMEARVASEKANVATPAGEGTEGDPSGLIGARIALLTAQADYEAQKTGAPTGNGLSYAQAETKVLEMKAKAEAAKFNNENVTEDSYFAAQRDLLIAQKEAAEAEATSAPGSGSLMAARISLLTAQTATEGKKKDVPAKQILLYQAQIDHYKSDTQFKKAKLYSEMFSISKTQGEASTVTATQATAKADKIGAA